MKSLFILFVLAGLGMCAQGQSKVGNYTINADTVTLASCDSTEFVLRNHTDTVPGFLFNTGKGKTIFKRGLQSLGSGGYILGADTLRVPNNAWVQGGNSFGAPGVLGTMDNNPLTFYTNGSPRIYLFSSGNAGVGANTDQGYKFNVNGSANVNGLLTTQSGISDIGPIEIGSTTTQNSLLANNLTFTTLSFLPYTPQTIYTFTNKTPDSASGGSYFRLIDVNRVVNRGSTQDGEETAIRVDFNVLSGTPHDLRAFHAASGNIIVGTGNIQVGDSTGVTSRVDITGAHGYSQLRLRKEYTPTSSSDSNGNTGDTAVDDNYFYYKTTTGWKRVALSTF